MRQSYLTDVVLTNCSMWFTNQIHAANTAEIFLYHRQEFLYEIISF